MTMTAIRKALTVFAAVLLCASMAWSAAAEVARASQTSGRVSVVSEGKASEVTSSTQFQEGDLVDVAANSTFVAEFADGSYVRLVGPARLRFVELNDQGRRIKLESGVIASAFVRGIALEIQTPYDASVVLQNATGMARVVPGKNVMFQRLDQGDFAKVWHDGAYIELRRSWSLNVSGDGDAGPASERPDASGDVEKMRINGRLVTYSPAGKFTREAMSDGSTRLTYTGDDYGTVTVGNEAELFLATGQSVTIGQDGLVQQFNGIVHMFPPLTTDDMYDEPIENIQDATNGDPRRR